MKRAYIKRIIAIVVVLAMVMVLSACSKPSSSGTGSGSTGTTGSSSSSASSVNSSASGASASSASATGQQDGGSDMSSQENVHLGDGVNWPTGPAAQAIPVYTGGTILHVTEHDKSDYIMIGNVTKDEAKAYWEEAQKAGFTNVTSKSESPFYDGFTYVALNDKGVSLSVTWAPGHPATMTLLSIIL